MTRGAEKYLVGEGMANNHLKVRVFGFPEFRLGDRVITVQMQKSAAILSYLAVTRRPASRQRLAEMLWSHEGAKNLRHQLHRLRKLAGAGEWLQAEEWIRLRVSSDLDDFERAVRERCYTQAFALYMGEPNKALLLGIEPQDAPEFFEWRDLEQARLDALLYEALHSACETLEEAGHFRDALDKARRLVYLDPLDESAHRAIMRLAFRLGHTRLASKQFEACQRILKNELDLLPAPETLALVRAIQQGASLPEAEAAPSCVGAAGPQRRSPLLLLRPPELVGRERVWEACETAWQTGQSVFISGPAGIGKSRLMLDFTRRLGRRCAVDGRVEDAAVPLSSLARAVRTASAEAPLSLAPWVRAELARLVPTLGEADHEPLSHKPLSHEDAHVRFVEAVYQFYVAASEAFEVLSIDELNFYDPASLQIAVYCITRLCAEHPGGARFVCAFRSGALPTASANALAGLCEQERAYHHPLEPLTPSATETLLRSLDFAPSLAPEVYQLTGGNPRFIIELLKGHRAQTPHDAPTTLDPAALNPVAFDPAVAEKVIAKRLNHLSAGARLTVQTLAALASEVDTEFLAHILQKDALEVAADLTELRHAGLLGGHTFTHPLVARSVAATTPAELGRALHRRIAAALEARTTYQRHLARHWAQAHDPHRALIHQLGAARDAAASGATEQAKAWLQEVIGGAAKGSDLSGEAKRLLEQLEG